MRLLRPYIPLEVRCRAAARQLNSPVPPYIKNWGEYLEVLLVWLACRLECKVSELHLDHNPALGAREKIFKKGVHIGYIPDANDPEHLIYRERHAHHLKTNVKGEGAQYPDRVLIKRERRRQKPKTKYKRIWPSRPLKSASRWPKRKFAKRKKS